MAEAVDTIRQKLRSHGLSADFGHIWVFDDYNNFAFQPWASRWLTFRRGFRVCLSIIKQLTCRHPQWVHCGSGRQRLPLAEAYKWKGRPLSEIEVRDSLPMVRHNWNCSRCKRISHRYTPDWSSEADKENREALRRGIEIKYGPRVGQHSTHGRLQNSIDGKP